MRGIRTAWSPACCFTDCLRAAAAQGQDPFGRAGGYICPSGLGRKNDFLYPFGHGGIARIKDTMAKALLRAHRKLRSRRVKALRNFYNTGVRTDLCNNSESLLDLPKKQCALLRAGGRLGLRAALRHRAKAKGLSCGKGAECRRGAKRRLRELEKACARL